MTGRDDMIIISTGAELVIWKKVNNILPFQNNVERFQIDMADNILPTMEKFSESTG